MYSTVIDIYKNKCSVSILGAGLTGKICGFSVDRLLGLWRLVLTNVASWLRLLYWYICIIVNILTKMLWVRISIRARCTTLCDNVCLWLATGRWFSRVLRITKITLINRNNLLITKITLCVSASRYCPVLTKARRRSLNWVATMSDRILT